MRSRRPTVVRRNGDGTFAPASNFSLPLTPVDIDLLDMNGDGWLDIATMIHLPPGGFGTAVITLRNVTDTKTSDPDVPGDVNDDGVVDALDVLEMFAAWGATGPISADVNDDLVVDSLDFLMLLTHWGQTG